MPKVKLADLINAIEFNSELSESFINIKTGDICSISDESLRIAEDNKQGYPDWMQEDIETAKHYLNNPDDYTALPSQHDADEYQMMEDFALGLENEKTKEQLLISLSGKGAFRRFKDNVLLLEIENEWYKFRDERYKQFALDWCEENEIALEQ